MVYRPPVSGDFIGENGYVEVVISEQINTFFMPVLGVDQMLISARAVAGSGRSRRLCLCPQRNRRQSAGSQQRIDSDGNGVQGQSLFLR